jgi:hypothetical protein
LKGSEIVGDILIKSLKTVWEFFANIYSTFIDLMIKGLLTNDFIISVIDGNKFKEALNFFNNIPMLKTVQEYFQLLSLALMILYLIFVFSNDYILNQGGGSGQDITMRIISIVIAIIFTISIPYMVGMILDFGGYLISDVAKNVILSSGEVGTGLEAAKDIVMPPVMNAISSSLTATVVLLLVLFIYIAIFVVYISVFVKAAQIQFAIIIAIIMTVPYSSGNTKPLTGIIIDIFAMVITISVQLLSLMIMSSILRTNAPIEIRLFACFAWVIGILTMPSYIKNKMQQANMSQGAMKSAQGGYRL